MISSVVGRLTNVVVPFNSWFGPALFGLMSQERSGTTSASARDALWCHALGKRKRTGKKRLKGHGPEHVYNTLGYTLNSPVVCS